MKTYDEHCKEIGMPMIKYNRHKNQLNKIAMSIYNDYAQQYATGEWYDIQYLKIEERTKDVYEYKEVMDQLENIGIKWMMLNEMIYFNYSKGMVS